MVLVSMDFPPPASWPAIASVCSLLAKAPSMVLQRTGRAKFAKTLCPDGAPVKTLAPRRRGPSIHSFLLFAGRPLPLERFCQPQLIKSLGNYFLFFSI